MARRSSIRHPGVAVGVGYAEAVVAGKEVVCTYVRLACERFLRDLAQAEAGEGLWEFRPDRAEAPMLLAGLLQNIKGPQAGRPLQLMAWQRFVFCNIFGFFERGTEARRFRQATVWVPRGNGKTTFAAPIALYLTFVEGEGGAEGYAAAVTRDQARILFDAAKEMVRRSPEFQGEFHVQVLSKVIAQDRSASRFGPISSDAKALDGLNVHVAVCDEIGSHKTSEVYDVLLTAMGKRLHPFLLSISTATGNKVGIGRQVWDYGVRVLTGAVEDDRLFALIYTLDEGDDPWDEASLIKANPGWGVSVQPDAVRAILRQARSNPAQEAVAMTRHLNLWIGADNALFSMRAWRACAKPALSLDDFEGQECHLALDLASKTDLASVGIVFPRKEGETLRYAVFARCYINEAAVLEARNAAYPGWAAENWLTVTDGNETDFSRIEDDVLELCRRFKVLSMAYDPWAATQFAQRLQAENVPVVEFRANTQNFSEPTKECDAAMQAGRIEHDGNPVLEWCIGNVVGRYDARSNVYPRKSKPELKIDAAITLIMGIARSMAAGESPDMMGFLTSSLAF